MIFFLEFGQKYINFKWITKTHGYNVSSHCKNIENSSRDFKDMSQKPDFQRDYLKLPESCINEKVVGKGLE